MKHNDTNPAADRTALIMGIMSYAGIIVVSGIAAWMYFNK